MKKKKQRTGKKNKRPVFWLLFLLLLWGCGGVEPEKRAFPLAISVDTAGKDFLVSYAMADLSLMTGQGKDQAESGEEQNTGSSFRGEDFQAIRRKYRDSQEYVLDLGHVKALILGDSLLEDREKSRELFREIQESSVLSKNLYLFRTREPEKVMEQNGREKDSIGAFLASFYENPEEGRKRKPVTLEDFFYQWSNQGQVPELPRLVCREGQIFLQESNE